MLDSYLREKQSATFDFRSFASPEDPLKHLFEEWVDYYRGKFALCRAIAPKSILEIGVRYGYSAITFLSACPSASYVGLDNNSATFGGAPGAFDWARRITEGFDARFELADTQRMESLPGERYDLVHVDEQQDGDGTYHDLELALEKGRWILVDGVFWSRENLEASTQFLQKYRGLIEYALVIPGYAGDMVIRVRDSAAFHRPGNAARDHRAIRDDYTREYFLRDCGGYQAFKAGSGRRLADPRLITLFEAGRSWKGKRVLDVGSGRGELSFACFAAGANVTGLDYSPAAVDIAREAYADALGERLEFVCEDVMAYEPREKFDRIIAADFVEHIDPETLDRVLERLSRFLAPGGRLVVHTWPNLIAYDYQHGQRRRQAKALGIFVPRNQRSLYEDRMHLNEQTPAALRRALAKRFGHAVIWVGSQEDPAAGLRMSPSRTLWRTHDSIYAVASGEPIDVRGLRCALTQDALTPENVGDVGFRIVSAPRELSTGGTFEIVVEIRNGSKERLASLAPFPVHLSYHWMQDGTAVVFDGIRTRFDSPMEPGEVRIVPQQVVAPARAGRFDLVATLVQEGGFWLDGHSTAGQATIPAICVR